MNRDKILIDALEEYISFLDSHVGYLSQIAIIHGFSFKQEDIDKGKELREKISSLKTNDIKEGEK